MSLSGFGSGSATGSTTMAMSDIDDEKPFWRFVTKLEKVGKGRNYKFQCNYFPTIYTCSCIRVEA